MRRGAVANSVKGPLPWLVGAFVADAAMVLVAAMILVQDGNETQPLIALAFVALAGAAAMFAVAWKVVDFVMAGSVRRLAADIRAIAHGGQREQVRAEKYAVLSPLPEAVNDLCRALTSAKRDLAQGMSAATAAAEEQAARLAAILHDLHEGVVVCNLRHQVVLYNGVAGGMLASGQLGLGRSLFEALARASVVHMLDMLTHRPDIGGKGLPFLVATVDGQTLFPARMSLIRTHDGEPSGYVVAMEDAAPQVAALARRDVLLREIAEALVLPVAHLKIAAANPGALAREAAAIENVLRRVRDGYDQALAGWWPMTDMYSADFLTSVARRFESASPKVTVTGVPVWFRADSHSLLLAVEILVRQIAERFAIAEMDVAAGADEVTAWIEIGWPGATAAKPALDAWLTEILPGLGGMTVRDVLLHHAGDVLTQEHRAGRTWLRLPMRKGMELAALGASPPVLPQRPEFYDLSLLDTSRELGEMGRRPLRTLTFAVFDTETTGLHPAAGDQIVQIGAVRVVNGRILSGESFNRIVHPGRPIPPESIRFHGITDEMVVGKPPIEVVLPQFKAYVADAVLVAHNAAFDLKFLRMREAETGVTFDNPVLDTMMLSSFLDGPETGHSLDDICERFGIEIADRHTALGDAIVTAAVLLRQLSALEARGITTLDQVVETLDLNMILHQRQQSLNNASARIPPGFSGL